SWRPGLPGPAPWWWRSARSGQSQPRGHCLYCHKAEWRERYIADDVAWADSLLWDHNTSPTETSRSALVCQTTLHHWTGHHPIPSGPCSGAMVACILVVMTQGLVSGTVSYRWGSVAAQGFRDI